LNEIPTVIIIIIIGTKFLLPVIRVFKIEVLADPKVVHRCPGYRRTRGVIGWTV
jgi:hypothetical protein